MDRLRTALLLMGVTLGAVAVGVRLAMSMLASKIRDSLQKILYG